jgi:hypothetical protein
MPSSPKPPIPGACFRFDWHCDACHGDSIFDIVAMNQPNNSKMACLGCGITFPVYLDAGTVKRYFRAAGATDWEAK